MFFSKKLWPLPNNYSIEKNSDSQYILMQNNESDGVSKTVVNESVTSYCFNKQYIAIEHNDNGSINYYLINTETGLIYGPITQEESFNLLVKRLTSSENSLCEWISP